MKPYYLLLSCAFLTLSALGQSYVYKRNPLSNSLELYQSNGGIPFGNPIFNIKRNLFGYIEVENVVNKPDVFTQKPDYSIHNFQSYKLPLNSIINSLNSLNQIRETQVVLSNNSSKYSKELADRAFQYFSDRNNTATNYINFYNSISTFPKKLSDGWYNSVALLPDAETHDFNTSGTKKQNDYYRYICKVENNSIVELYQNMHLYEVDEANVYRKIKLSQKLQINNCRTAYKDEFNQYRFVYFLDNLIDSSTQIGKPAFALYSLYNDNFESSTRLIVYVGRNISTSPEKLRAAIFEQKDEYKLPYFSMLATENYSYLQKCDNSNITIALKKPFTYCIGVIALQNPITNSRYYAFNDIKSDANSCQSTTLTK